eukprot:scaffold589_cov94-Skeletonema_dohrnii-CCMP3373.AAC.1
MDAMAANGKTTMEVEMMGAPKRPRIAVYLFLLRKGPILFDEGVDRSNCHYRAENCLRKLPTPLKSKDNFIIRLNTLSNIPLCVPIPLNLPQ